MSPAGKLSRRAPLLLSLALLASAKIAGAAPQLIWTAAANTTWDFSTANWSGDASVFANGDILDFGDVIPAGGVVSIAPAEVDPGEVDATNNAGTYTISGGAIGGTGEVVKTGSGTLILSSSNSYSGGTFLSGGTLVAAGGDNRLGDASGAITWSGGGVLRVQGAALVSSRNFLVGSGGGSIDTNGVDSSTSGSVSGAGLWTKTGVGNFTVSGPVGTSSQSTPIAVQAGSLTFTGGNLEYITAPTLPGSFAGDLNVDSGVSLNIAGAANFAAPVKLSGGGTIHIIGTNASILGGEATPGTAGAVEIDNPIVLNSQAQPQPFSTTLAASFSNQLTLNGGISGNSDVNFIGGGSSGSPLVILNAAATYTGNTFVGGPQAAVLRLGRNNALPTGTALDFTSSGGALDLNGFNQTVAGLSTETTANGITNTGTGAATFTVNQPFDSTYQGGIGTLAAFSPNLTPLGSGFDNISLVKSGTGGLRLLGTQTYTGSTTVSGGTLIVNGGISGANGGITSTSGVAVTAGGMLAGQGTVAVAPGGKVVVQSGGVISPGDNFSGDYPTGTLTLTDPSGPFSSTGTFDLRSGGTLFITLDAFEAGGSQDSLNSAGGYDNQLVVNGKISLAGTLTGTLLGDFTANPGDLFFIVINQGGSAISGTFAGNPSTVTFTGDGGSRTFSIGYTGNSTANTFTGGNDVVLEVVQSVPEAGSVELFLAGVGVLALRGGFRRKRR